METATQNRERKFKKESFLRIRHFAKKKNQPTNRIPKVPGVGREAPAAHPQPADRGVGQQHPFLHINDSCQKDILASQVQ